MSVANPPRDSSLPIEEGVTSAELSRRPARPPDHAAENRALVGLVRELASSSGDALQSVAEAALQLCHADSAGISLLETASEKQTLRWRAVAGRWSDHRGSTLPRATPFPPGITPAIEEVLLVPFHVAGETVGTLWVVTHDEGKRFDSEDLRILTSLAEFASAAYQASLSRDALLAGEAASAFFSAVVENSDDAIITKDLDGVITSWNKAAEHLFGYTDQEAVGQSIKILIPPDRLDEEPRILERLRRGQRMDHFETIRRRKDGELLDISLTISPVKDARGRIIGVSKTARDITQWKRALEAVREADRRKTEFIAMMAHELRNPLASVRNTVELLGTPGAPESELERARLIADRQVRKLTRLVDDLLDVSRIGQGKLTIRREHIDLAAAIESAVEASQPRFEASGCKLELHAPSEPIHLDADVTRLAQVISNLLDNAAKYSEPGTTIHLTARRDGSEAVVTVTDSGIGIPADMLPRIFEMFTQVDRSLERSQGGLGVGLSLVKRLVELHGGSVEASSEGLGRGSQFVVRLPLTEGAPPPPPIVGRSEPAALAPRRVLIADDNEDGALGLALLLRRAGHEVRIAHDGEAALEAAGAFLPNLALVDLGMPKLSGLDVARGIREQPWGRSMILVAVTGYGEEAARKDSMEAGFDRHWVKPIELEGLHELLRSSKDQERAASSRMPSGRLTMTEVGRLIGGGPSEIDSLIECRFLPKSGPDGVSYPAFLALLRWNLSHRGLRHLRVGERVVWKKILASHPELLKSLLRSRFTPASIGEVVQTKLLREGSLEDDDASGEL